MKKPLYSNPRYNEAVTLQERLREKIVLRPLEGPLRYVGGADVSFNLYGRTFWGGIVVCDAANDFEIVDGAVVVREVDFPYIPGLLAFREVPLFVEAFARLERKPEAIIVDGQGIAHPRGIGSASHLGVELGVPTIGCAKNRLCGENEEPPPDTGGWSPLLLDGSVAGAVLRTRKNVKPVFVSPGHLSDVETSVELIIRCSPRYRIPEPVRKAHALVNDARRNSQLEEEEEKEDE